MSPSGMPILFALSLALTSGGSSVYGRRTDPVTLLRQTLGYWRKIYQTYHEEVTLGYCWADYLLEISGQLSANLSTPLHATTGNRFNAFIATARGRRDLPFPENAMRFRETRREGSRATTARSTVSRHVEDPNRRRIASTWRITHRKQVGPTTSEIGRGIATTTVEEDNEIDGTEDRITTVTDSYVGRR